jgi:hypothetical protein
MESARGSRLGRFALRLFRTMFVGTGACVEDIAATQVVIERSEWVQETSLTRS